MDEYYQNGPLPTWIGWYVQHLPHWFHVSTALATLIMELAIVWMIVLPRPWRIICFLIVTPWQIGVILTANYCFLNYLVLMLGFLLLDDRFFLKWVPGLRGVRPHVFMSGNKQEGAEEVTDSAAPATGPVESKKPAAWRRGLGSLGLGVSALLLIWIFYATTAELIHLLVRDSLLPTEPITALDPFRIANQYGLFAVMTRGRYEIEFQGSRDGQTWTAYPFRFKPQALNRAPGIYAPYQPRFEWNLWFASLGSWQQYPFVPRTELRLLENDPDVLSLFAGNPFADTPPRQVRAVLWQYWFTTSAEKRATGNWWRRKLLGVYAPVLERDPSGRASVIAMPDMLPPHE
jgi:Lipase maturation factor